ncbi:class I SAM-dependent methyltransferase [Streptomyces beijiangensis]|uniref:Class I SAM-dependent methyltransferase n=1 Tax=Streptomyces beijiangensis TaxID=163361 RepID=A0A939FF03_9ACTN|nr:class I SAM-dependent methyltransferase [Streptomyces beijiangensis]MBO0516758.1 class I SAM-dependent methyltransferase [Streptomyces beijiangensis]
MLRDIFDEDAELYDRVRPAYPAALVGDLVARAGLGVGSRVLEVAPGTGKLTLPLARTGADVTGVELGPSMAAVARRNLAAYPRVRIEVGDFETWALPGEPYDLVVIATAYHWIDPLVRVRKPIEALRPGGVFAVVTTHHVAGGSEEFFAGVQEIYERWDPATPPGIRLRDAAVVDTDVGFGPVVARKYTQEITYTSAEYLDVLLTYSGHRALVPWRREGLLSGIGELIDTRYGGRITKRYMHELISVVRPG